MDWVASDQLSMWLLNGTKFDGATNSSLILNQVEVAQAGNYSVSVTNLYGIATSSNAILGMVPIQIIAQPKDVATLGGSNAFFSVEADAAPPAVYQWLYDGTNLIGATNTTLSLAGVQLSQAGAYSVIISNDYGLIESSNAILMIAPLKIVIQPTNTITWAGGTALFGVRVAGAGPYSFEWQRKQADVEGLATNLLIVTNVQAAQFGQYSVIIGNTYGSVTSGVAFLFKSEVALWGSGINGETNLPFDLTNVLALAAGPSRDADCYALRGDDTILSWPLYPSQKGDIKVLAISGGVSVLGIETNGMLGGGVYDLRTISGFTNIVGLASDFYGTFVLRSDGVAEGTASIPGLSNIVAVTEGYGHSLALTAAGTVIGWGNNNYGQATPPAGLSNITAIAAGYYHSLALKKDGTVVGWGLNSDHQVSVLSGLSNVVAIAGGGYHSLARKNDGKLVAWGQNTYGQTNVPRGLAYVNAIAAGTY